MKRILLCVDVQRGFLNENSAPALDDILALAGSGRYAEVWATRFINPGEGGSFESRMGWRRFQDGSPESELVPALAALDPQQFDKRSYSAPPTLIELARERQPCDFHIVGFDTEVCVLTIATQLFDAGMPPYVVVNACGSHGGARYHEAGLAAMSRILGPMSLIQVDAGPLPNQTAISTRRA